MLTPIKIDNRMNGYLGKPARAGKRPAVIHLHERYGIVQHTTDLGEKFVDAGYVTIVPDLFSRFTGDRGALAPATTAATWTTSKCWAISTRWSSTCAQYLKST